MTESTFIFTFSLVMFALGFILARLSETVRGIRQTVTCRCGATVARDILIVDPSDVDSIRDTLSENCLACHSRAIVHSQSEEPAGDPG